MPVYVLTTGERDVSNLKKVLPNAKLYKGSVGYDDSCKNILKEIGVRFKDHYWNGWDYIPEGKLGHWCSNLRFAKYCNDVCVLIEDDVLLDKSSVEAMYKFIKEDWNTPILCLGKSGDMINVWNGHKREQIFDAARSGIDNPMDIFLNSKHLYTSKGSLGKLLDPTNSASSSIIRSMNREIKLKKLNNEIKGHKKYKIVYFLY